MTDENLIISNSTSASISEGAEEIASPAVESNKPENSEITCIYKFCSQDLTECKFASIDNRPNAKIFQKDENKNIFEKINNGQAYNNYTACLSEQGHKNSWFANFWASNLATTSMLISFVSSILSAILVRYLPQRLRIYGVFSVVFFIFAVNILLSWTVYNNAAFFGITLTFAALIIFSAMLFQTTAFGILSPMHFQYVCVLMEGQGLGGVWIACTKMLCDQITIFLTNKNGINMDPELAGNLVVTLYWLIALVIIIVTWYMFDHVFLKMEDYIKAHSTTSNEKSRDDYDDPQTNTSSFDNTTNMEKQPLDENLNSNNLSNSTISFCEILRAIQWQAISVFLTFFICLLLFPGVLSNVKPHDGQKNVLGITKIDWSFLNFGLFFVFNIGDWVGKKLARWSIIRSDQEYLLLLITVARAGFYPLICYGLNLSGTKTTFLANKYSFIIINFIFASTSGYMGSLPMRFNSEVLASKLKNKYTEKSIKEAQSKASSYMVVFLIGGLLCGSLCSFLALANVQNDNMMIMKEAYRAYVEGV